MYATYNKLLGFTKLCFASVGGNGVGTKQRKLVKHDPKNNVFVYKEEY